MDDHQFYGCKGKRFDPLLCDIELPLHGVFHPLGFPLSLATNSQHVIDSAAESWGAWREEFATEPLDFRVLVESGGELAAEPVYRKQGALLSFVSNAHNFAASDSGTLCASFHLSEKTAADHVLLRWLFLDAMALMLLTQRYVVSLHAACVARHGHGILICGNSGAGKSTLAVACGRAGLTFLSDDCTWIRTGTDDLIAIGKPHQARLRGDVGRHFPELNNFPTRTLPNGKLSMEVPTSCFAGFETAHSVRIGAIAFLERDSHLAARKDRVDSEEAAALLLQDLPSYGPVVNSAHERTVRGLAALPAWRLRYSTLDSAIALLREI